jgi:hypothetical protein
LFLKTLGLIQNKQNSMEFLMNNYEWVFSGIGVAIVGFFLTKLFGKKTEGSPLNNTSSNTNTITINNQFSPKNDTLPSNLEKAEDDRLKERTRILFVDDQHAKFKMVSILKKAGWSNTKSVKDIIDLDDPRAKEADIVFVDINGVGTTIFEDQGLGLASALKNKYPEKKIVIYSAETTGDRFHKALREVDDCLPKNAEPYQFINLVESFAKEIV